MENIFKNAYFGKAYETRDGSKAVYIGDNTCLIEGCKTGLIYSYNGRLVDFQEHGIDIVSEWHKEINEEELGKIAIEESKKLPLLDTKVGKAVAYSRGYKDGYRKALASS